MPITKDTGSGSTLSESRINPLGLSATAISGVGATERVKCFTLKCQEFPDPDAAVARGLVVVKKWIDERTAEPH